MPSDKKKLIRPAGIFCQSEINIYFLNQWILKIKVFARTVNWSFVKLHAKCSRSRENLKVFKEMSSN